MHPLTIADNGVQSSAAGAGVNITPTSAATSFDSWYTNGGSSTFDTINGGFDFFFRSSIPSTSWDNSSGTNFRPFNLWPDNNGLGLFVNSPVSNTLQLELRANNGSGAAVMDLFAKNTAVNFVANTLYHIGGTASTDGNGIVTIRLFAVQGTGAIDTTSNANLIASATSASAMDPAGTNAVNHAFNSATGFLFGKTYNYDSIAQTQDYDSFRIYNTVPTNFIALTTTLPSQNVSYYPDLPSPNHPADNPTLPSGMDPFNPPVSTSSPAANSPTIAEFTRTGGPGDSLVLTGDQLTSYSGNDLGKDTAFVAFGQTGSSGTIASSTIPALEANKATLTLDSSLPSGSAYMLWARNSNGYGRPVMVNTAEAWWVDPDQATRGQTISLYGKNLSYHGGTSQSWIYIKPASGAGQWATVTAVNPYKVNFVVPAGLANGTYEVWAHNGSGGKYGWSGPVTMTVNNGVTWSGPTYNVKTQYGAVGNGIANDATAIQNAINAAHTANNFATVYIPAGTYLINTKLQLYSNIRLDGDGAANTILKGGSLGYGSAASQAPSQIREWETATLANGPAVYSTANAFGGQAVSGFDQTNESVTLSNINGGTGGGAANLTFRYANGNSADSTASLYINGVFRQKVTFTKTGTWDTFNDAVVVGVNLAAGNNSIQLYHAADDTGGINLDRLTVGTWGQGLLAFGLGGTAVANVAVQELTVDISNDGDNVALYGKASNVSVTDVNLTQTRQGNYGAGTTYLYDSDHLFFKRVNLISSFVVLRTRQIFFDSTNFYGTGDKHLFNGQSGISELAATNNTGQDYDNTTLDGWCSGVWWKFLLNGETAERNFYYENNTSHDLAVRHARVDTLWGEQYSWEQEYSWFVAGPVHNSTVTASVVSATSNTVTFDATVPSPSGTGTYMAAIIDGKGVGQWRTITVYNGTTITLDKPWNVIPDSSSTISVLAGAEQIAIYNNHMDGKTANTLLPDNAIDNSSGIQPYGGVFNLVADSNFITDTRYGIYIADLGERNSAGGGTGLINYFEPDYFHLYVNNTMQNNRFGLHQNQSGADFSGAIPASYMTGMVYRGNTITSPVRSGFMQYAIDPGTTQRWVNMNVMEQTSITNAPIAIDLTAGHPSQQGNQIFINNNFSLGTAPFSGSIGVKFYSANQLVELENNTWSGFQTLYSGTSRGQVLATPMPVIELSTYVGGGSIASSLLLWNEGTASLTWSATDDAAWLSIGAGSTITAGGSANPTLTINPAGLAAGLYTGTITVTSGTQTRKATVLLNVIAPPASIDGTAGDDIIRLVRQGANLQAYVNNAVTPIWSIPYSSFGALAINGLDGNDTVTIDLSGGATPIPAGGLTVDLGTGTSDALVIAGSSSNDTLAYTPTQLLVNGSAVNYSNAEQMLFNGGSGSDALNVNAGTFVSNSDLGATTQNLMLNIADGAAVSFNSNQRLTGLNLTGSAKLDLNDNDLILDYTGSTPLPTIQSLISSGRNGGAWTGNGITSTAAKNNLSRNTSLGLMEASDYLAINGAGALFDGQTLDSSMVLIKYTYNGDTDFNGTVNFDDYSRIDLNFNTQTTPGFAYKWLVGDFDFNNSINFDDYSLIDLAFNTQGVLL